MLTLNDTPLYDNQAIFVMKISLDVGTLYLASESITLSGRLYDGEVIINGSLNSASIEKSLDIENGGTFGQIGSFEFAIARYTNNSKTNSFFDEFYPNTTNYLTSRTVDLGIVWEGATNESEITWLKQYYIYNVSHQFNQIDIECFEIDELESMELPYYTVQKDFDNSISYFENAPEESIGQPLPIVYGVFDEGESDWISNSPQELATAFLPVVLVDKEKHTYSMSSNKLTTGTGNSIYKYDSNFDTKILIMPLDGSTNVSSYSNTLGGSKLTLLNSVGLIYGKCQLSPRITTVNSDYVSVKEMYDKTTSSSVSFSNGETIAVGFDAENVKSSYDVIQDINTNICFYTYCSGSGTMYIYIKDINSGTTISASSKTLSGSGLVKFYPWSVSGTKEFTTLLNYEVQFVNASGSSITIYETWMQIEKFHISGVYQYNSAKVLIQTPRIQVAGRF